MRRRCTKVRGQLLSDDYADVKGSLELSEQVREFSWGRKRAVFRDVASNEWVYDV